MKITLACFLIAVSCLSGCSSSWIYVREVPVRSLIGSGTFVAGAARTDITPPPGFPTCGSGTEARTARGVWTRLYSHAIYMEDGSGHNLALVSADLWSMTGGLADRVAEIIARDGRVPISRERMVIAGTHTHLGPGNFSSWEAYNAFASAEEGFDRELFEFLANRIAGSIESAYDTRQPAKLSYGTSIVSNLARNRSFDAFLNNTDAGEILKENSSVPLGRTSPEYPDSLAYRAVDPKVRLLKVEADAPGDRPPIALAAFVAVHPISMGGEAEVYSSDLFGVAEQRAVERFRKQYHGSNPPVVAIFNGAEGDISPVWEKQSRPTTLALGDTLCSAILRAGDRTSAVAADSILGAYNVFPIANVTFVDSLLSAEGVPPSRRQTSETPIPGDPALGGAEDGRTFLHRAGWIEGIKGERTSPQSPKQLAFDPRFLHGMNRKLVRWLLQKEITSKVGPRSAPIGVYKIGDVVLATLPGEFTTTLGRRIRRVLSDVLGNPEKVVLIGLANEYLYYVTTPEEYEIQDYEGAATIYGGATGSLIATDLRELALEIHDPPGNKLRNPVYCPGGETSFDPSNVGYEPALPDDGLENVLESPETHRPQRDLPRIIWTEREVRKVGELGREGSAFPDVSIESRDPATGAWSRVSDNRGLDFVTVALSASDDTVKWCAMWLGAPGAPPGATYRFVKTVREGTPVPSDPFSTGELLVRKNPTVTLQNRE